MASQESKLAGTRRAAKAGSWYTANPDILSKQLEKWLDDVPNKINGSSLPIPGARVIIAPHAGYSYSGPCAAWAYKALDLSKAERIFVLGPSHTYGLSGCALTTFAHWATPLGDLVVDQDVMDELRATGRFADIPRFNDTEEHSLEMHMPYIYKRLEQTWRDSRPWPTIVPMVVGDGSPSAEKRVGRLLAPYLRDPANAFVISSDFCHWGSDNFGYSTYCTSPELEDLQKLSKYGPAPTDPPIHEAIRYLDEAAMASIETGIYDRFRANIDLTENTVCGRHPIGVMMAALEELASKPKWGKAAAVATDAEEAESNEVKPPEMKGTGKFAFVQYRRSSLVNDVNKTSVSYASAYAIV